MTQALARLARALAISALVFGFVGASPAAATTKSDGAVYTLTNASSGNRVLIFDRAADGTLSAAGSVATGGNGGALGSQGSLVSTHDGRWLLAANAGSNTISTFAISEAGLTLRGQFASGGAGPSSITARGDLVYVLNAGGTPSISGFRARDGQLSPIPGSIRPLGVANAGPVEVAFAPSGRVLVVSDKGANKIETFVVGDDGVAGPPTIFASSGPAPFGFAFGKHGEVFFSEAASVPAGSSSASSYTLSGSGTLTTVSASVSTTQGAACWLVVTKNGRFAYTTNTSSGTISRFDVDPRTGALVLASGVAAGGLTHPIDMALAAHSQILYALAGGSIAGYRIGANGSLSFISTIAMTGTAGLAAR